MAIYILEIPHQRAASCWTATDEADAISKIFQTFVRYDDMPGMAASFDDWCDYNGSDLSSQRVYMTAAEAIQGLEEISGHGALAAIDALRRQLIDDGEITEEYDAE